MEFLKVVGFIVLWLYTLYLLYVLAVGVYRAHLKDRLTGWIRVTLWPICLFMIVLDFVTQYTLATLIFLDAPMPGEHLVTQRLERYIHKRSDWRHRVAKWFCENALDPLDPEGIHCEG